jgi:hypothetical protein
LSYTSKGDEEFERVVLPIRRETKEEEREHPGQWTLLRGRMFPDKELTNQAVGLVQPHTRFLLFESYMLYMQIRLGLMLSYLAN